MRLRSAGTIGVDIDGRWVRAAQVRRAGSGWELAAALSMPRKDPAAAFSPEEAGHLMAALDRTGFTGSTVQLGAPRAALVSALLDLPPRSSGAPLEQIARTELARSARLEPGAMEAALWELPFPARSGDGAPVMAVGLPHAASAPLEEAFRGVADLAGIDARACSLLRSLAPWAARAEPVAVLDLAWEAAALAVVHRGVPVYERVTPEAGLSRLYATIDRRAPIGHDAIDVLLGVDGAPETGELTEAAAAEMAPAIADHARTVIEELGRSMAYVSHRYAGLAVASLVVIGPGAGAGGLAERARAELSLDARVVTCADALGVPGELARFGRTSSLLCAIGLAMPGAAHGARRAAA